MCSTNDLNNIIDVITRSYKDVYGEDIIRILLYGSYARGDNRDDSDVDIVAIVRGDRKSLQERLRKIWDVSSDLELEYGTIISPTVIPADEFERFKEDLPYYRNILEEGVELIA